MLLLSSYCRRAAEDRQRIPASRSSEPCLHACLEWQGHLCPLRAASALQWSDVAELWMLLLYEREAYRVLCQR